MSCPDQPPRPYNGPTIMGKQQRQVLFSGNVQGVGFRYTACRIAGRHDVRGYVRNLPDGQVECVVEGDAARIDAFLDELEQAMDGYVQSKSEQTAPCTGKLPSFTVRF